MRRIKRTIDRSARRLAVTVLPDDVRRRIVMRFPRAPMTPPSFGEAAARLDAATFEQMYAASDDPYGFAESEKEAAKYAVTLELCGDGPFDSALELGCSIGVFTSLLAPSCRRLLAIDISELAVNAARDRLAAQPHVTIERRTLPHEMPTNEFDLVVASDIFCYWDTDTLARAVGPLEASIGPGGRLVVCHSLDGGVPKAQTAESVHSLLRDRLSLEHVESRDAAGSRFDVFARNS
jgi:hypothetical protein